jgi:hypothetical protein
MIVIDSAPRPGLPEELGPATEMLMAGRWFSPVRSRLPSILDLYA